MEPDFDSILSKKIRRAEQTPVKWNKEVVWRNVQSQTGTKPRYGFLYYAAAAIILLLIYSLVQPISNAYKPQVADEKVRSTVKPTAPKNTVGEKEQDDATDPVSAAPAISITSPPTGSIDASQPAQPEIEIADVIAEPLAPSQVPVEAYVSQEVATVPERKIKPIVGVITESYSEGIANVKHKKRLRKLKSSDETPWEDPRHALVFAMRK